MRFTLLFFTLLICVHVSADAQLIDISDAHALPFGSTVTVTGQVTSGSEFGTIRYMQDATGGIAIFSSSLAGVNRGDNITVTGVTSDYQNLLEVAPVNSWMLNSTGHPDPSPLILTPSMLDESNESMFVRINNVAFTSGGVFQGNSTYSYTSNGESGVVYIRSGNPLVGQQIPTSAVILYGINSQYGNQYQMLPRDLNDIVSSSVISITTSPAPENISTSGFDVSWNTDMNGNGFVRYGLTPLLELGTISGTASTTNPVASISGMNASTVVYIQAYSVAGSDTAISSVMPFITSSNSTGEVKVYFDRSVDNTVASPSSNLAVQLQNTFDDTLRAYIDRAQTTLDIAIYSFTNDNTALLTQAVNDAWNRGVQVRIIVEAGNANAGLPTLNPAIPIGYSPTSSPFYYGIMHNKFFIIDAFDSNPNKPVVMTGSTNWSNDQLNDDRNNLVFIQDQSLAKVYTMEFEEMWGGNGPLPDTLNAKFGPDKTNNTPHVLNIGGKKVEVYFSPTDDANNQILKSIQSSDNELYFATMVFTRYDLAYAIEDRVTNFGVYGAGIVNDSSGSTGLSFQIIQGAVGVNMLLFDHPNQTGILHHKYLIVDQSVASSDPLVLTGSHNWSSAANQRNDENTIIIHDVNIANQYYQEFRSLFNTNGGALSVHSNDEFSDLQLYPNPGNGNFYVGFQAKHSSAVQFQLIDISGRQIFNFTSVTKTGENTFYFSNSELGSGIYFLKILNDGEEQTVKVLVGNSTVK